MNAMNRVQLIGELLWPVNLWRDRTTGRTFGKALLAVTDSGLAFVPVVLQDEVALDAARYLGEGSRIEVAAHLRSSLVTNRDLHGTKRTRRVVSVIANRVTYVVVRSPGSEGRP
jgi:single-stranded DNA-binding protein